MYRNLVNQRGSLTLTLPKDWVEKNNLSPKDQVEIQEMTNGLLIKTEKGSDKKSIEINAKDFISPGNLRSHVGYLYRSGYDEILILNATNVHLKESFSNLVGIIVTEEGSYQKVSFFSQETSNIMSVVDKMFLTINVSLNSKKEDRPFLRNQVLELKDYAIRSLAKKNPSPLSMEYIILVNNLSSFASYIKIQKNIFKETREFFENLKVAWLKRNFKALIILTEESYSKRNEEISFEFLSQITKSATHLVTEEY